MSTNRLFVLSLLLCLFSAPLRGQQPEADKSLLILLKDIQDRNNVQFNYASDLIEGIEVPAPDQDLSLTRQIEFLQEQTGLEFKFLSESVIAITAKLLRLCGYVRDKDSFEPLPYTTIQSGDTGTVTNEDGYFELIVGSPSDLVLIRHIGHRSIRREYRFFNTQNCSPVYMVQDREKLTEIVLSDYLIRGMDKLDNGAFQLDFDRFTILPGLVEGDVLQSVQAFPGIQSIDETVSNINIRGGSHDQNLILWDDIKMYQSGHFFGLISMYNPQITQKVQLQKNGTSAAMTDGVSGTIAMGTDKIINPEFKGSLGLNMIDVNGFLDAPLGENTSVQLAGRKAISDFFETPTYSEYFKRIAQDTEIERNASAVSNSDVAFDFYDASARLLSKPTEKDLLRVNFIHTSNEVVFNENAILESLEVAKESSLEQKSTAFGLYHTRNWSSDFSTEFSVYQSDYKLRAINSDVLQDQRFLQENSVSETGVRAIARKSLSETLEWGNGYHFVETKITNLDDVDNPIFRRLIGEVLRTHGVFSEVHWNSGDRRTTINGGIRGNYLEKFRKFLLEPRLSLNHKFLQWFHLEVLGEFKHQNTSQIINFQNDFLGVEKRRWQLSNNDDIPIIRSRQGSLGLSYVRKDWLLNAVGFFKGVEGITTQSQGFTDGYEFVKSAGNYDSYGVELLLRKQFNNLNMWFSYGYLQSQYHFPELEETDFRSNFDIRHALSTGITYTAGKIHLALGGNWRTGKPFTSPITDNTLAGDQINYGPVNEEQLEDYFRLDVSAIYRSRISDLIGIQAGISMWNVTNRINPLNTFFRPSGLGSPQQIIQESLGITPNASLKILFN
ncbi:TonB-dependent receptor [Robiginitalea aurantiaca]|uniref:TonB-dependent receptor plug domain-containing protein n=1 Tax=Robiginitalea aurantiaca TaxID=3056915 RepID=A0ABT7WIE9_9FLAO|nr:TonB-dependent receptor plug domain-containing protein [Robiginitalea aurantiaca]MDM9632690.1 TonB-dependent receptor plug domain-containing protein [Robiginitalea aurantiaca]